MMKEPPATANPAPPGQTEGAPLDSPWVERLAAYAVRRHRWRLAWTAIAATAAGLVALRLKLDALPDITSNQVLVLTRATGLTPEEVERRVTLPSEVALGGIPGLLEHRSLSRYGVSSITAVFEDDVDPYRARQLVQERLAPLAGALPAEAEPPELGPLSGGLGEIFHLAISARDRTTVELLELARYKLTPLLRAISGVVEVNSWGGEQRTLDVRATAVRLAQRGLTMDQLRAALERATGAAAGANLEAAPREGEGAGGPSSRVAFGHRRLTNAAPGRGAAVEAVGAGRVDPIVTGSPDRRPVLRRRARHRSRCRRGGGEGGHRHAHRRGDRQRSRRGRLSHGADAPRGQRAGDHRTHPRQNAGVAARRSQRSAPGCGLRPQHVGPRHAAHRGQEPPRGGGCW